METADLKFELRSTTSENIPFAWALYRDLMRPLTEDLLEWNEHGQKRVVELALAQPGSSVIVVNKECAGWLQVLDRQNAIYLGQI